MASSQHSTNGLGHAHARPTLLPYNLKLRNLCSIHLRNLVLPSHAVGRSRGKTIDDDADPRTFVSPGKLRALREERSLEHSHSSSDLRQELESSKAGHDEPQDDVQGSPKAHKTRLNGSSTRTRPKRLRRRSTLEWMNAGPVQRQGKLEHVVAERMANVFFSLHVAGNDEPVYISETVPRTMDPTFRSLDLSRCTPSTLRHSRIVLRFWVQSLSSSQWRMLCAVEVNLQSLHFIGRSLDESRQTREANTIIFQFKDGVYTMPTAMSSPAKPVLPAEKSSRTLRSSTFDALLRLSKLTDSIQDALATRNALAADLDRIVRGNKSVLEHQDQVTEVNDRLKTIAFAKATVAKQLEKARKQIAEKQASAQKRKSLMAEDQYIRSQRVQGLLDNKHELPHIRDEQDICHKAITAQRRRIVEDVEKIYTIQPLAGGKSLAFKIRDLPLPNAEELDSVSVATTGAALGYVAHAVLLLSFYLDIKLPYPVNPMGSTSWITDPISLLNVNAGSTSIFSGSTATADKAYPLHMQRVARFRFDYGVFLLNKNIQLLLESGFGIRVLDIRHTLPNLKYLLYVATAGEGELPARKVGGIRGLTKGRPDMLSRASSSSSLTIWSGLGKDDHRNDRAAQSLRKLVQ